MKFFELTDKIARSNRCFRKESDKELKFETYFEKVFQRERQ